MTEEDKMAAELEFAQCPHCGAITVTMTDDDGNVMGEAEIPAEDLPGLIAELQACLGRQMPSWDDVLPPQA